MKTAIVAGATGLVGRAVVDCLLDSPRYHKVIALTRRPLKIEHPKFTNMVVDFNDLSNSLALVQPDDVFCCLGTTMAKAGTKEKFLEVDFAYPVALAKATVSLGAKQYLLVSAMGANMESSIFYNRVKGQVEEAITAEPFLAVHIFRPSLLIGPREEKRSGEEAAKMLYKFVGFLTPAKYKPIEGRTVARAMVEIAGREQEGVVVHESKEMQTFAERS